MFYCKQCSTKWSIYIYYILTINVLVHYWTTSLFLRMNRVTALFTRSCQTDVQNWFGLLKTSAVKCNYITLMRAVVGATIDNITVTCNFCSYYSAVLEATIVCITVKCTYCSLVSVVKCKEQQVKQLCQQSAPVPSSSI